ncbi:MAG: peptidoglycan-binding protein [Clostridia bacterium]|nr:peptidoglycan-binding protein [Clostridia bacterium]MBQ6704351.1 peptidoglycan-binding protein [Clostridia bacterium]
MENHDSNQKKYRRGKQERKSFLRRIRIPLLTAAGALLTAFVVIPASFDILDISPVVVEIAEEMVHLPSPSPVPAAAEEQPAQEEPLYHHLRAGDTDPVVAHIQERLAELNYIDGDEPSETFGEPVAAALRRFQRVHHMTETGEADPLTQEILFSDKAAYYRLQQGDEGEDVESLQERLYELGYEVEKKNGYFGVATAKALSSFQTRNKIDATGIMDTDTADILYSNNARPKVDPTPTPTPKPKTTPRPTARVTPKPETNSGVGTTKTAAPTNQESGGGSVAEATGDVSGFIATAKAQQGKPYVLGDEGPNSFDCSGLVHYSLNANGVKVGRMSAKNYAKIDSWETVYSVSDLKTGDLLFFRSDSSATISHTGIWLGGSKYIHASSSAGKVVISSWSDWSNRNFSHGKRVF